MAMNEQGHGGMETVERLGCIADSACGLGGMRRGRGSFGVLRFGVLRFCGSSDGKGRDWEKGRTAEY
jgi:hypothetical protein